MTNFQIQSYYWTQRIPPDKFTNLELWGVNVDFKSYEKKWTIHGIIQNMGFYPPTETPCVKMRENLKTKCCEYIAVYQDDLYIASPTPEIIVNTLEHKYKLNINADFHLELKIQMMQVGQGFINSRNTLKSYMKFSVNFSMTTLLKI